MGVRSWVCVWVAVILVSMAVTAGAASRPRILAASGKKGVSLYRSKPGSKIGDTCINPKDGAQMVWVPAGEFLMGGAEEDLTKRSQHKVRLSGYWVYKCEVSVKQYRKFCKDTGRHMPLSPHWGWKDDHPIVNVSWSDAAAYAKWSGASLPTEAQWEKAARGTDGRAYPWGNTWDISKCANRKDSNVTSTRPVGSYPSGKSPYGCLNMAGNAWEWCKDWFQADYYSQTPQGGWSDPQGPAGNDRGYRVMRGGGWYDHHSYCCLTYARCAYRDGSRPTPRNDGYDDDIGFRLVR